MKTSEQKLFPIKLARKRVSDGHTWHWLQRAIEPNRGANSCTKKPKCGCTKSGLIETGTDEIGVESELGVIIRSQSTLEEILRGGEGYEIHGSRICMKCRHMLGDALSLHIKTKPNTKVDPEHPFIITHDGETLQPKEKGLEETKKLAKKTMAENPETPLTIVLPFVTYKQTKPVIKEIRSSYT